MGKYSRIYAQAVMAGNAPDQAPISFVVGDLSDEVVRAIMAGVGAFGLSACISLISHEPVSVDSVAWAGAVGSGVLLVGVGGDVLSDLVLDMGRVIARIVAEYQEAREPEAEPEQPDEPGPMDDSVYNRTRNTGHLDLTEATPKGAQPRAVWLVCNAMQERGGRLSFPGIRNRGRGVSDTDYRAIVYHWISKGLAEKQADNTIYLTSRGARKRSKILSHDAPAAQL